VIKILVVDDHDLVRTGFVRMLDDIDGFNVIGEAESGEKAVALARENPPDIVLMDVKMPGIGGLEATKKLLNYHSSIKIIAVTAGGDDVHPSRLMQAGAMGYLTKGTPLNEMVSAIKTVFSGKHYMSNSVAQQMALKSYTKDSETPFEKLSERELQTAIMIANGNKAQTIANTFNVSPKTVNSYRYRIFDKLDINSDVELAILAVKHGVLDIETR
jgi:DNA-binding NarL/FixJ family response regulator